MKVGPYEAKSILTGSFALDGGAMFGTVPKVLWNKTNPSDELNRIDMEARALLLISDKHKILVDVGLGDKLSEKYGEKFGQKFKEMYKWDQSKNTLTNSLKKHSLMLEDITDVILTHLHFDHAGGATTVENGELVPTFKNAKYYVQKKNLETAQNPNLREKASYFKENFEPLLENKVLNLLEGDVKNLLPQVSVFVTNGHTQAQQLVKIGEQNPLIYCGDIIPTSTHVRLPFVMGYDLDPLLVIKEKQQILEGIASENGFVFFEHDPYMDAAKIVKVGSDFNVSEKVMLN
ncbi:MAG: MBL fold metallo-hydrolase [Oligoflexia bacterium]|nr:MBL fold metallo-hydrolase [Oligoflexia bacterium]